MLPVDEARRRILEGFEPLPVVEMSLHDLAGMVLEEPLVAPHDLPLFDNSAMDGYAVRRSDLVDLPARLQLAGEVRAGEPGAERLDPGTARRIMTGAPIPPGADAVVPVEDASEEGSDVIVAAAPPPSGHIRPTGDDVHKGDVIVPAGIEITAGELAMIASMGLAPLRVHRRPHVVVLSTGDELVASDDDPGPGQIRDSNSVALSALVQKAGGTVDIVGPIADDRDAVRAAVIAATETADLIVSSGGVSVGRYDFVKEVVEEIGSIEFWRVAMQPGKPVVSGRAKDIPFLGLPGNPVSIHIGFEQFVRPAIRKMRGCKQLLRPVIDARLGARLEKRPGRLHLVRVRLEWTDDGVVATPTGAQGSHIQSSLIDCHGVARFGIDDSVLEVGERVAVEVWRLP